MKPIKWGCRLIAFFIFITLILGWQNIYIPYKMAFQQNNLNSWTAFLTLIGTLYLALNIAAAWGIFLVKKWAFWIAYIAIIFSTIFFGMSYLPLTHTMSHLFLPTNMHYIPTLGINILFISCIVWLQIASRKHFVS